MKTHRLAPWLLVASAALSAVLALSWRQVARGATPPAAAAIAPAVPLQPILATSVRTAASAPAVAAAQPVLGETRYDAALGRYFKIVTSAALLERGIAPESEVCFHGGHHRIQPALLKDSRRDGRCLSLASALGKSANVVFAKLAGRDLEPSGLRVEAGRFLFNGAIPFDRPVEASPAEIPDDRFQFATTAAGFGSVRMSPLHAALIAAIVANNGLFVRPPHLRQGPLAPLAAARRAGGREDRFAGRAAAVPRLHLVRRLRADE